MFELVKETAHRLAQGAHSHPAIVRLSLAAKIRVHPVQQVRKLPKPYSECLRDAPRSPSEQPGDSMSHFQ